MKRRDFLQKLPILAAPILLSGIPIRLLGKENEFFRLAASNPDSDRVLVLIQLHGGNDGLNTLIPIDQYSQYYTLRSNIAIPQTGNRKYINLDDTLPDNSKIGLHPSMTGVKSLYDQGKVAIVQGVEYENLNQSHFRSRDIWFMGGNYNDYISSGWAGRYLDHVYPNYPDNYPTPEMEDPLAIEVGQGVSLVFHRDSGLPMSISINDPEEFFNLINTTGTQPPENLTNTYYGEELRYILDFDKQSDKYADRLRKVFKQGANSGVAYPNKYDSDSPSSYAKNELTPQLKMIARLLSGGCKTRVFMVRLTKFDTHAQQVTDYDPSLGKHAALLYHISGAMEAFQNDLKALNLEDRVMSVTFSEFGRRAQSNGSYGTDHGTSAPMFVFGKCVKPGVVGTNPDLSNLDNGNLRMQHDYRQVFSALVQDWMGASPEGLKATHFESFADKKADIISCVSSTVGIEKTEFLAERFKLNSCFPNPVSDKANFSFYLNGVKQVSLKLYDTNGNLIKTIFEDISAIGLHEKEVNLEDLKPGSYIYTLQTSTERKSKTLIIQR